MSKENDSILLERLCDLISEQMKNAQDIVVVRENLSQIHGWIAHDIKAAILVDNCNNNCLNDFFSILYDDIKELIDIRENYKKLLEKMKEQERPEEQGETSTAHGKSLKEYIRRLWQC